MARYGLGMVAPVMQVRILILTVSAHRKIHHRCIFPVIGNTVYDGVSGAADHAAYERMLVSGIMSVIKFSEAVRAYCKVGRYHGCLIISAVTADYRKTAVFSEFCRRPPDVDDLRRFWFVSYESVYEICDAFCGISDIYLNKAAYIQDFAFHTESFCCFGNIGSESDTLDYSPQLNFFALSVSHFATSSKPSPVLPETFITGASLLSARTPFIKNSSSKSR